MADVIIIIVIIIFIVKGWIKGFIFEFTTFAGLVVGAAGSLWLYKNIPPLVGKIIKGPVDIIGAVVFITGLVLIVYLFGALGRYLHDKADAFDISTINAFFGGIFGGVKGAIWSGICLLLLKNNNMLSSLIPGKGSMVTGEIMAITARALKALDDFF